MSTVRFDLAKHPTKDTITMLTSLLEKVTKANDHPADLNNNSNSNSNGSNSSHRGRSRSLSHPSPYTCFHARSIPSISIHAYLSRILKYCPCANECFLALLVYFDRLSKSNYGRQPLRIDSFNIHRLIIAGVMIASKLFSDVFFTNTRYAKVKRKKKRKRKERERHREKKRGIRMCLCCPLYIYTIIFIWIRWAVFPWPN